MYKEMQGVDRMDKRRLKTYQCYVFVQFSAVVAAENEDEANEAACKNVAAALRQKLDGIDYDVDPMGYIEEIEGDEEND